MSGDRLCIQIQNPKGLAKRVFVTFRPDIESRNKLDLLVWQRRSIFGRITAIDAPSHRISLNVARDGGTSEVQIDGSSLDPIRAHPGAVGEPIHFQRMTWDELRVGDALYIRADKQSANQLLRGTLLVSGGLRSFVGAISSIDEKRGFLGVRDFYSKQAHTFRFDNSQIYVVGSSCDIRSAGNRTLYPGRAGLLESGDSVLIFGTGDEYSDSAEAFILLTGFSPGGMLAPGPAQVPDWIFASLGLATDEGSAMLRPE